MTARRSLSVARRTSTLMAPAPSRNGFIRRTARRASESAISREGLRVAAAVANGRLFLQERGRRGERDLGLVLAARRRAGGARRAGRRRREGLGVGFGELAERRKARSLEGRLGVRRQAEQRDRLRPRRTSARNPAARRAGRAAWPSPRRCVRRGATRRGRARRRGRGAAAARRGSSRRRARAARRGRTSGAGRGASRGSGRRKPRPPTAARRAGWPRAGPR